MLREILPYLNDGQAAAFEKYYLMLAERNEQINLTTVIERQDVYVKHFADSLSALPFIEKGSKVLDIGCGAGFPSVPLKIAEPSLEIITIDSVNKKINFVKDVIACLGLENIIALHTRVEDLKVKDFDIVTARAVSALAVLCEYGLPFLRHGGRLIAYKSDNIDEELLQAQRALKFFGGVIENIVSLSLPGSDIKRKLVIIRKNAESPKGYPRGKNLPRLKPII